MKIREALRLREMELSNVKISRSIQCSRTTLIELFRKCDKNKISYDSASKMSDHDLEEMLYPQGDHSRYQIPEPDFPAIQEQLEKYPNLNLKFVWDEYRQQTPDGLSYSQFCERFKRWRQVQGKNLTMVLDRKPGYEMEVDWAGDKPALICDRETGELQPICLFVASLGNSGRLYAEAFPNMSLNNWICAHTHALEYYGARPRLVIPDNAKTAVLRHIRYDPHLNPTYLEWAEHYEVAVTPARPRKPKDKPIVEGGVGWLQTWLLGRLRHRYFFSFADLNRAIREIMADLDRTPYQKRAGTRLSVYLDVDLPQMRSLPATRFEKPDFKTATVGNNYHIEYDRTSYSVPHTYYRKKVTVRATSTTVEVLYDNMRVCSHIRNYDPRKRYVTDPEHMPKKHRRYLEQSDWNGRRYRSWANRIGINTYAVINTLLNSCVIEEQAYKSCMGILQLSRKYSNERLEAACSRARKLGSFSYTTVHNILKNGQDKLPLLDSPDHTPLPEHKNVRGAGYYK